ncbi:sensor histidine kinase [Geobacter sulfurreducens]|uniref:sensor histidine kinase n=1 Tax=Geobacter sulfurreducens TaxID=35554 RepID=UPI0005D91D52|nr:histidine kinase N-terminal 7TM domain-containing protein [Geobacter sulfurreducens]AJY70009.1 histidine kinase [Geobacter sulfurreducens]UTG92988.1 two-component sensor histidine kinase [Geobacter sulfurreducens]
MPFYISPYLILPILSFLVNAVLAAYSWRNRRLPAAQPLFFLMIGMAGWSCAYALNTAATSLSLKIRFFQMGVTFVCLIAPSVIALALESIGRSDWLTRRRLALICVVPALSLLLVWTNEFHLIFRHDMYLYSSGPLLLLGFENGPYFPIHQLYVIFANIVAIVLFGQALRRSPRGQGLRFALLIAATALPILVELLAITPVKGFSMTTSSLFISGSLYVVAIFRYRLLDIAPLARTALFAQLGDPVLVFDIHGALADCNNSARILAGDKPDHDLADICRVILTRIPELETHLAQPTTVPRNSYAADTADAGHHWSISSLPLQSGGVSRGLLVQLHDISDLKEAERNLRASEQNLRELNHTLQERVESETTRRLERERLLANHARLAAMGDMLAAVAHQWRQPLSTVGMIVQNIRNAWHSSQLNQAYLDSSVETAMKQIHQMSETIDTFRRFFRPDKQKEALDAVAQIKKAVSIMEPQISGIRISSHVLEQDHGPAAISGFPNEFTQVIVNLLSNARDAIRERQSVEPAVAGEIMIVVIKRHNSIEILVRDNGCGIAPESKGRIFEPYYTTKEEKGGTGIGLYMSRMIIEDSMGGKMSFSSEPGETDFTIILPAAEEA